MQSQKRQNDLWSFPRQTIQYHNNPSNTEEAEVERFYEDLQDLFRTNTQKRYSFHYRVQFSSVVQSCLTLCDPMDCSLPGCFIHGIFQARVLQGVAISFSSKASQNRSISTSSALLVGNRLGLL